MYTSIRHVTLQRLNVSVLVVALENVDDLEKSFCVIMCYTVTAIKHKTEFNQNVNLKMFRITVDYLGAI